MSLADLKSKLNQRKAQQAAKKAQYIRTTKLNTGKNRVRILPSWELDAEGKPSLEGQFYHDFGMHFVKDKEGKLNAVYICTEKTYDDKHCAVCDAIREGVAEAKATGNVALEKLMGQARASGRVLVNALMRDSEEPNKPVILELPAGVFDNVVDQIVTFADDDVAILCPDTGHDFIISKTGSGIDTEYSLSVSPKSTKVTYDQSAVTDLTKYVAQESEQGLLKATGAVVAVTGLPAPRSVAALSQAPAATGTDDRTAGAFMTPPAASAATAPARPAAPAAAAAATTGAATVLSAAATLAEDELNDLEGELVGDEVPWEADVPAAEVVETPAPTAAPEPAATQPAPSEDDLAAEIDGSGDDLDDILNGLDDL